MSLLLCAAALTADLVIDTVRMEDCVNPAGAPAPVRVEIRNAGVNAATGVTVRARTPDGLRVAPNGAFMVAGNETVSRMVSFAASEPGVYPVELTVEAPGFAAVEARCEVRIDPPSGLPNADYVPEPRPVKGDYEIGAWYFPAAWTCAEQWDKIRKTCPERQPLLGWYDIADPEIIDWHIKWLAENGFSYIFVDWYWCEGKPILNHWPEAFQRARHKRFIKWALMWCNHNRPKTHSEADMRKLTRFWIENYFRTPEYYTIDGKPVVVIWSSKQIEEDLGEGSCRRLLELSRAEAKAAGLKGIWFIAIKHPEGVCSKSVVEKYKDQGFDMTTIYHYLEDGSGKDPGKRYAFDKVVESNKRHWQWRKGSAGILPFIPNLSTGWDDRPWNNSKVIEGRTCEKFRRICRDAKEFADQTGIKRLCLGPLNEWGEGSYAEPNAEFGFGHFEAVRDTFCARPAEGWPRNYTPKEVGRRPLGVLPQTPPAVATAWDFTDGLNHGWRKVSGISVIRAARAGLQFMLAKERGIIDCKLAPAETRQFDALAVRMKVTGAEKATCALYWKGDEAKLGEAASARLRLMPDGEFHDYRIPLAEKSEWKGKVDYLRLDPEAAPGAKFTIERVGLEEKKSRADLADDAV